MNTFFISSVRSLFRMALLVTLAIWANTSIARILPPYLNWSEDPHTTVTVSWERDVPGRGIVHYGATTNLGSTAQGRDNRTRHVITLRQLTPGTRYYYQVESTDGFLSDMASFRTAPQPDESVRIMVRGDTQQHSAWDQASPSLDHITQVQLIEQDMADVYVHIGDIVWDNGWLFWEDWFAREQKLLAHMPFMPVVGNHEVFTVPHDATHYLDLFALPDRPAGRRYYAFTVGNARFIMLNTEQNVSGQNEWLTLELQAAANDPDIRWTFVVWHRSAYTWAEKHGRFQAAYDNWVPIISQYGADIVFMGHNHLYEQSGPFRGVRYVTTGGGGGDLTAVLPGSSANVATTCFHFVEMTIEGASLEYRAIKDDDTLIDSLSLTQPGRIVQVTPAFPRPGETATITYDASQGPLAAAGTVRIHLGIDAFASSMLDELMTFDSDTGRWTYEVTVPMGATQRIAFVFHDGDGTWHSNHTFGSPATPLNWQALLGRVAFDPPAPIAGQPMTVRYHRALGAIPNATQIVARIGFNNWHGPTVTELVMTNNPATQTFDVHFTIPDYADRVDVAFRSPAGAWDSNAGNDWGVAVSGAHGTLPYEIVPIAVGGTSVITDPPDTGPNNVGDNMDFNLAGTPVRAQNPYGGFANFGDIYFNYDATNLYVGGIGNSMNSNHVMMLFLGVDTLTNGAYTLWHKTGQPNALDLLHNVVFTDPMNAVIVYGDEYGDGTFASHTYAGYDFGQGLFHIGTDSSTFDPVAGARLSQFDGVGQTPTTSSNDDGNRQTTRWESSIPWAALNAPHGIDSLTWLKVAGVAGARSVSGNDRYVSSMFIGETAYGARDGAGNYAYNVMTIRPLPVLLPHGDEDGDGLPNAWKHDFFGSALGPGPDEDSSGNGLSNWTTYVADLDPTDPDQHLPALSLSDATLYLTIHPTSTRRNYAVEATPDLIAPIWQSVTNVTGTGGTLHIDTADSAAEHMYFRYRISLP